MRVSPYIFDIVPVAPRGLGRQRNGGYRTLLDWSILQKDIGSVALRTLPIVPLPILGAGLGNMLRRPVSTLSAARTWGLDHAPNHCRYYLPAQQRAVLCSARKVCSPTLNWVSYRPSTKTVITESQVELHLSPDVLGYVSAWHSSTRRSKKHS